MRRERLGVQVDPELTFDNKANKMLGLIRRLCTFLDGPTVKKVYSSLVRPILEYGNVIWAPTLERNQRILETVQRRATKLLPELKCQEYCDRLKALKLPSLYYRRARGGMIEVYKYLYGMYKVGMYKVGKMPLQMDHNTVTRGLSLKLKKEHVTARQRRSYFRHRAVNRWNSLTEVSAHTLNVSAHTLNAFKAKIDKLWCTYTFEQCDNFPPMCTNYSKDQLKAY